MSTNPLALNPTTDIDGPDVFAPIEPEPIEDLGDGEPEDEEDGPVDNDDPL